MIRGTCRAITARSITSDLNFWISLFFLLDEKCWLFGDETFQKAQNLKKQDNPFSLQGSLKFLPMALETDIGADLPVPPRRMWDCKCSISCSHERNHVWSFVDSQCCREVHQGFASIWIKTVFKKVTLSSSWIEILWWWIPTCPLTASTPYSCSVPSQACILLDTVELHFVLGGSFLSLEWSQDYSIIMLFFLMLIGLSCSSTSSVNGPWSDTPIGTFLWKGPDFTENIWLVAKSPWGTRH